MRYLPLTATDRRAMLARIGASDVEELFADIPQDQRLSGLLDLPKAMGEIGVERALSSRGTSPWEQARPRSTWTERSRSSG